MNKSFNVLICGVGGQGLITLTKIIDWAALIEGVDVKSSELHGLSQKGGSVETFIRLGKKISSPLFSNGEANLVIGLELEESLRAARFANSGTMLVVNDFLLPHEGGLKKEEIINKINEVYKGEKHIAPATEIVKKEFGNEVLNGIYILGYLVSKNMIPLKKESVVLAISKVIPEKYLEINQKAFDMNNIKTI